MSERVCDCGHGAEIHKAYYADECQADGCFCERFLPANGLAAGSPPMDEGAEAHLERIKRGFLEAVDEKYRRGQAEHGGRLWRKPHMSAKALEEAVDLIVYLLTIIEQERNPAQVSMAMGEDER